MTIEYYEYIDFLFNRDPSKGEWRFDIYLNEPELDGFQITSFVRKMCENYTEDLSHFSDWQLGKGFEYIFNNSFSDTSFLLRDGPASLDERVSAIKSLKPFFKNCLNERCIDSLGHLSEEGNDLNAFCYMLWDVTPLTFCEEMSDGKAIYDAILDVMEYSLYLSNRACIESGLHGLGHMELYSEKAPRIVRKFLKDSSNIDLKLKKYAKNAEVGNVL